MQREPRQRYRFGSFLLEADELRLWKGDLQIPLRPKSFQVLVQLVRNSGRLVSKDELLDAVWADVEVTESTLAQSVREIRRALQDEADNPRYLETVPRGGYRFISPVGREFEKGNELNRRPRRLGRLALAWASIVGIGLTAAILYKASSPLKRRDLPLEVKPFTSLLGQEGCPSFSPDGTQIAFHCDGGVNGNFDIYLKRIGGEATRRLTDGPASEYCPAWSPDGARIAFVRQEPGKSGIFVVDALGGAARQLHSLVAADPELVPGFRTTLSWSPDGRLIAFRDRNPPAEPYAIHTLAVESGQTQRLTRPIPGSYGDHYPAFSPDGRELAFVRNDSLSALTSSIYIVSAQGGEPKRLTFQNRWISRLAWRPDGRQIVFSAGFGASGTSSLWRVSAQGENLQRLPAGGENAWLPATSRLGERLAYQDYYRNANIWRIAIADTQEGASQPRLLIASTRNDFGPQFSPDGSQIVFHSERSGSYEIWTAGSDGSNPLRLTDFGGPDVGTARWSHDGQHIVFDAVFEGHKDIFIVRASGGRPRQLTSDPAGDMVPSFSLDDRWVYFASNRSGQLQVWRIPTLGGKAVQVTRNGGFCAFESPDGGYLYYSQSKPQGEAPGDASGIWRIPLEGGQETLVLGELLPRHWGYWAVVERGIYFLNGKAEPRPAIDFFDFATHGLRRIAVLKREPPPWEPGLAVSPDEGWILYPQVDEVKGDIWLVEGFR